MPHLTMSLNSVSSPKGIEAFFQSTDKITQENEDSLETNIGSSFFR